MDNNPMWNAILRFTLAQTEQTGGDAPKSVKPMSDEDREFLEKVFDSMVINEGYRIRLITEVLRLPRQADEIRTLIAPIQATYREKLMAEEEESKEAGESGIDAIVRKMREQRNNLHTDMIKLVCYLKVTPKSSDEELEAAILQKKQFALEELSDFMNRIDSANHFVKETENFGVATAYLMQRPGAEVEYRIPHKAGGADQKLLQADGVVGEGQNDDATTDHSSTVDNNNKNDNNNNKNDNNKNKNKNDDNKNDNDDNDKVDSNSDKDPKKPGVDTTVERHTFQRSRAPWLSYEPFLVWRVCDTVAHICDNNPVGQRRCLRFLPCLLGLLHDGDEKVVQKACYALSALMRSYTPAHQLLLQFVHEKDGASVSAVHALIDLVVARKGAEEAGGGAGAAGDEKRERGGARSQEGDQGSEEKEGNGGAVKYRYSARVRNRALTLLLNCLEHPFLLARDVEMRRREADERQRLISSLQTGLVHESWSQGIEKLVLERSAEVDPALTLGWLRILARHSGFLQAICHAIIDAQGNVSLRENAQQVVALLAESAAAAADRQTGQALLSGLREACLPALALRIKTLQLLKDKDDLEAAREEVDYLLRGIKLLRKPLEGQ